VPVPGHLHEVGGDPFRDATDVGPIRVILAEPHAGLRRNLRLLLEREPDLNVVAEATDFEGTVRELLAHRPEVLVLDLGIGDGSIAELILRLRDRSLRTAIVIITMHDSRMLADQTLRVGAAGFVLTDQSDVELVDAVRGAARGVECGSSRLGDQ